ncbi:MAG: hypothetical protein QOD56_2370, partial [Gammaproteobacteria bacterium]|nr:hypothetical protein [Gammaproteobacteria bacterium]
ETVFRLSADALRAASGQVRCGRCGEVFNALARLAEDASGFAKGESSYELEWRADEILESTEPEGHESPDPETMEAANDLVSAPGVEVAQLQFVNPPDDDLAGETSLEFTLPPGDLDRIFIETRPSLLHQLSTEGTGGRESQIGIPAPGSAPLPVPEGVAPHGVPRPVAPAPAAQAPAGLTPAPPTASPAAPKQEGHPQAEPTQTATQDLSSPDGAAAPPPANAPDGRTGARRPPGTRISGLEVSEVVRQEMLASYTHAELPEINEPRHRLPYAAWLAAAITLGLLLIVQIVRGHGEWLAAHAPLLGSSKQTASLASYQLRQWGVTGDPAAKGTLRVRASIMNTAAQLQPYPLLRVTLANRFGARVGAREFEPAEYLGAATGRMLAPGERVDATLDIVDPGKDAEGFEIDVCVRGADKRVACAGDAAAQAK